MSLPSLTAFVYKGLIICFFGVAGFSGGAMLYVLGSPNNFFRYLTAAEPAGTVMAKIESWSRHDKTLVSLCRIWQYVL